MKCGIFILLSSNFTHSNIFLHKRFVVKMVDIGTLPLVPPNKYYNFKEPIFLPTKYQTITRSGVKKGYIDLRLLVSSPQTVTIFHIYNSHNLDVFQT